MALKHLRTLKRTTALVPATLLAALVAHANPQDGQVVQGAATISAPDPATLNIQQQTDRAIINWQSFDISVGETTQFFLPSTSGVTLNRVVVGDNPSEILGTLKSNGTVMVINPDGILFGPNSVIDVGGLLAITSDIEDNDFMAGNYNFSKHGNPSASIVNQGTITVKDEGVAALVAPGVRNEGIIAARFGKVTLGAANQFTLDFFGDDLISLTLADELTDEVVDLATGKPLADRVSNSGKIIADGGTVVLKAATARKVVNSVINNTGIIEAKSVGMKNGKIVLSAATAKTKKADVPVQKVKVSGTLKASGAEAGETGGLIALTGEQIELLVANVIASGDIGGGTVLVGGDYLGGNAIDDVMAGYGISREPGTVETAMTVSVDANSTINADAIHSGNGGKVVVWADTHTNMLGHISARGGTNGGDGGFIETSGEETLKIGQLAPDASAAQGSAGTWLLDPASVDLADYEATINSALDLDMAVLIEADDDITGNGIDIHTDNDFGILSFLAPTISLSNSNIVSTGDGFNLIFTGDDVSFIDTTVNLLSGFFYVSAFNFVSGGNSLLISSSKIEISDAFFSDSELGKFDLLSIVDSTITMPTLQAFGYTVEITNSHITTSEFLEFSTDCSDEPVPECATSSFESTGSTIALNKSERDGPFIPFDPDETAVTVSDYANATVNGSTISGSNADVFFSKKPSKISNSSIYATNGGVYFGNAKIANIYAAKQVQAILNPETNSSLQQAMLDYFHQLNTAACLAGTGPCGTINIQSPLPVSISLADRTSAIESSARDLLDLLKITDSRSYKFPIGTSSYEQCTDFARWAYEQITGKSVSPGVLGDAMNWGTNSPKAQLNFVSASASLDPSDIPIGSILVWDMPVDAAGNGITDVPGHVAVVVANENGQLTIVENNWFGHYVFDVAKLDVKNDVLLRTSRPTSGVKTYDLLGYILPP